VSVYTRPFFVGIISATNLTLFTPTANIQYVVRDVELSDDSGAATNQISWFVTTAGSISARIAIANITAPYGGYQWQGRIALPVNGSIGVGAGSWPVTVCITGYELQ